MIGFNAMMQAITKNVVMPPMTSVLTVVEFSRSLKIRSRSAGASGILAFGAARAAMQSLLRHAHTDTRLSGSRSIQARTLPRAAGSIRAMGDADQGRIAVRDHGPDREDATQWAKT